MINGDQTLTIEKGSTYEDPGATATYKDTDITSSVVTTVTVDTTTAGTYTIKYNVTYNGKNAEEVTRKVTVKDMSSIITLNGEKNITIGLNQTYTNEGATAKAHDGTDITSSIVTTGTVDTTTAGTYTIEMHGGGQWPVSGTNYHSNGGGGSGEKYTTVLTEGTSYSITIGSGGSGAVNGSGKAGGTGGTTKFGSLYSLVGGSGAKGYTFTNAERGAKSGSLASAGTKGSSSGTWGSAGEGGSGGDGGNPGAVFITWEGPAN